MMVATRAEWKERWKQAADRAADLAQQGLSDQQIAESMGLSVSRAQYLRRTGGVKRAPAGKLSDDLIAEIKRLADETWPPGEIAQTLGISYWGVSKYMNHPENGREWNKVARWAALNHRKLWEELNG